LSKNYTFFYFAVEFSRRDWHILGLRLIQGRSPR